MTYTQIKAALDAAVDGIAGLPKTFHENETSQKPSTKPFVRTTLLPARPNRLTVGAAGKDELMGLYQIDVYYPTGAGTSGAMADADVLVAAFPRTWEASIGGHRLRVTQAWMEARGQVNNWYTVAVTLSWSAVR